MNATQKLKMITSW